MSDDDFDADFAIISFLKKASILPESNWISVRNNFGSFLSSSDNADVKFFEI